MKVLYLINGLGTGGAERSLYEMAPVLAEHGVNIEIACLFRRGEGVGQRAARSGMQISHLPQSGWMDRARAARELVATHKPDVVHTTLFEANLVGRLAVAGQDVPLLTSLVNTSYDPIRLADPNVSRPKLEATRLLESLSGRLLTDHYHAISATVRTAAVRTLRIPRNRITVVPRGRDETRLGRFTPKRRENVRERLGVAEDQTVLLHVGRQEFQKGQVHLLRAIANIRKETGDLLCLMAGRDGNATATLREVVSRQGLDDIVRFLGHREDVPDLLTAADLFVFPSLYEGLGGALIEAMALEVPIVASDIAAVREVTEDGRCALLVPPGDSIALGRAVRRLLTDPERQTRYRSAGRRIFERRYRLPDVGERMEALYRDVAAMGRDVRTR